MEIEVHNVAKVREAKICLDRIAVIAGPNGSGKSTIAKGVLTLRDTLRSLPYYVAYKRASDLLATISKRYVTTESTSSGVSYLINAFDLLASGWRLLKQPEELCKCSFWENDEAVLNYLSFYFPLRRTNQERITLAQLAADDAYTTLKKQILEWLSNPAYSDEAYGTFVISNAIKRVYCDQIGLLGSDAVSSLTLHEADTAFAVCVEDGRFLPFNKPITIDSDTYYLEPCHILDEIVSLPYDEQIVGSSWKKRYYGEVCTPSWRDFANKVRNANPTMEEAQSQEARNALLRDLSRTLNGQLTKQNQTLVFEDRSVNGQIYIPNVASGAKSMALIARAIENGWIRERDLLIIDEPESNLHPEWQVRFAEWLVELSDKLGLRLLLNTHSPYFLRAIERFCGRESMIGKLHVYLMEQDRGADGTALPTFSAHDVTDDIGQVYRAMAKPFEEIE